LYGPSVPSWGSNKSDKFKQLREKSLFLNSGTANPIKAIIKRPIFQAGILGIRIIRPLQGALKNNVIFGGGDRGDGVDMVFVVHPKDL
jgi:hypothetical protein